MRRRLVAVLTVLCLGGGPVLLGSATPAAAADVVPLPVGTDVDYQLGGNRSVPAHVGIVVRDREAAPAGRYDVCYVNGFQTQPHERAFWRARWDLVLKRRGQAVVDGAWGEWLLDVRTPAKRQRIAAIVGRWTDGCARAGYEAVEYDNLDSFTRSRGLIKRPQAVAFSRLLTRRAHADGLAAGQKNLAGFDGRTVGFDFAVAEECGRWRECSAYTRFYGRRVLAVEYRRADYAWTCQRFGAALPVVLRDLAVSPTGVRQWC